MKVFFEQIYLQEFLILSHQQLHTVFTLLIKRLDITTSLSWHIYYLQHFHRLRIFPSTNNPNTNTLWEWPVLLLFASALKSPRVLVANKPRCTATARKPLLRTPSLQKTPPARVEREWKASAHAVCLRSLAPEKARLTSLTLLKPKIPLRFIASIYVL
mgnify:CR=1 FL=1